MLIYSQLDPQQQHHYHICHGTEIFQKTYSGMPCEASKPLCPGTITGPRFNIKMSSYQYRKSHCGDKTVVRSSYLHNGISYTGKMASLYWFSPQVPDVTKYKTILVDIQGVVFMEGSAQNCSNSSHCSFALNHQYNVYLWTDMSCWYIPWMKLSSTEYDPIILQMFRWIWIVASDTDFCIWKLMLFYVVGDISTSPIMWTFRYGQVNNRASLWRFIFLKIHLFRNTIHWVWIL